VPPAILADRGPSGQAPSWRRGDKTPKSALSGGLGMIFAAGLAPPPGCL